MARISFTLLILISVAPALAQEKEGGEPRDDEPAIAEKLGRLTLTLDAGGHTGSIHRVFFTPDGKQVITLAKDHSIRFWDVESGKCLRVLYLPGFGGLSVAALSGDGKRLAVASRCSEKDRVAYVIYVVALPEGKLERPPLRGHGKEIEMLAMSPDGKRLASGDREVESAKKRIFSIRLWNLEKDEPAKVLPMKRPIRGLALSPDGTRLARVGPKGGEIIDLATGKTAGDLVGESVVWSPDGKTLATFHGPKDGVRLWDAEGKEVRTISTTVRSLAFSEDSRKILVTLPSFTHEATIFDVATGKALTEFRAKGSSLALDGALAADGKLAVTGGGKGIHEIFIWKAQDGAVHKRLGAPSWLLGNAATAAWSADSKSVSWDELAKRAASFHLGDLQFGPALQEKDKRGTVLKEGELSLKKLAKGGWEASKSGVGAVKFGMGHVTLVGKDRVAFAASPPPKVVANYTGFALYDAVNGKLIHRFEEHNPRDIRALAPSPDGRFLLSVSQDQTLRVWSLKRDKPLLTMYVRGNTSESGRGQSVSGNDWIIWTPEGYYAATPGGERLMGFTTDNGIDQMPTFYPAERFRKVLYRPDVIKLLLEKGNLKDALETANAALKKEGKIVPEGVADPNKLLPPQVSIEILDKSNLPRVKVNVKATASGKTQPITALRLMLDGRPLPGKEGFVEFKNGTDKANEEWIITLPGAKQNAPYQLTVLARGPDTSAYSASVEVPYVDPKKQPNMHVVAIGINDYKERSLRLGAPVNDAKEIAANFEKCAKGPLFRDVRSKKLLDKEASPAAILNELDALRKNVKHNDLVVIFFAGHGVKTKSGFYLLTPEADTTDDDTLKATCLSGDELRRKLGGFPCQVLLMVDACHSGAFGKRDKLLKKEEGVLSRQGFKPATDDLARDLADDDSGVAILCAAMGNEKAQEKGPMGLFTKHILTALNNGDPRVSHRGHRLFLHHLHTFVLDRVAEDSDDEQHPFLVMPSVVESFPLVQFARKASGGQ